MVIVVPRKTEIRKEGKHKTSLSPVILCIFEEYLFWNMFCRPFFVRKQEIFEQWALLKTFLEATT